MGCYYSEKYPLYRIPVHPLALREWSIVGRLGTGETFTP
jgi:hypothetical protein